MLNAKLINKGKEAELILEGRLDSNSAIELDKIMTDIAVRFNSVVLNLEKLDSTSSAGLRIILKLRLALDQKGGNFAIKSANTSVMEVFELTGFAGILNFID